MKLLPRHANSNPKRQRGSGGFLRTPSLTLRVVMILALLATAPQCAFADEQIRQGELLAPAAFRAAAAMITPALVAIEGFGGIANSVAAAGGLAPGAGPTTGLVISPDGYIITSTFNLARKPPIITVILPGGQRKIATLLGRDETRHICLLKISVDQPLPTPVIAPRSELRVGQWAVAAGIGYGDPRPALSAGIVSAVSRASNKAVQTDANLSPANYGGPLIDLDGRVIGICVPLKPQSQDQSAGAEWYDSGIGFAIPVDGLDRVLAAMKAGQTLRHPFLGVQTQPTEDGQSGAIVGAITPGSPAEHSGFQLGDHVLSVDGIDVHDNAQLATAIGRYVAGDYVEVAVRRFGSPISLYAGLSAGSGR